MRQARDLSAQPTEGSSSLNTTFIEPDGQKTNAIAASNIVVTRAAVNESLTVRDEFNGVPPSPKHETYDKWAERLMRICGYSFLGSLAGTALAASILIGDGVVASAMKLFGQAYATQGPLVSSVVNALSYPSVGAAALTVLSFAAGILLSHFDSNLYRQEGNQRFINIGRPDLCSN